MKPFQLNGGNSAVDDSPAKCNSDLALRFGFYADLGGNGRVDLVAVGIIEGQGFMYLGFGQVVLGSDFRWGKAPCLSRYHQRLHS